jgi:hypothetical protein
MKAVPPTICFDSSVCIRRSKGSYPDAEWRKMWKYVVEKCDYAIMPLVFTELVLGVAGGDEAHFDENRKAVKILYPTQKKRFLAPPGTFVLEQVLGRRPKNADILNEQSYAEEARILMAADSKAQLSSGRVQMPRNRKYSRGMDFKLLENQMASGQNEHVSKLEQLRAGTLEIPSAPEWAMLWMKSLGITPTPEEASRVAAALDAAYRYECFLWNEAKVGRYDFSKHRSDWIDSQLLYYLADTNLHLVIDDSKLAHRVAASRQADRVHSYRDFVAKAMAGRLC